MRVEVIYAPASAADRVSVELIEGSTAIEAVDAAGTLSRHPEIGRRETLALGIFGRRVAQDQVLLDGDRVEIYRPLLADPKEARRRRTR